MQLPEDKDKGIVNVYHVESYKLKNANWKWSDFEIDKKHNKNQSCECQIF